ncbi:MAG: hypothetical protein IKP77_00595 [Acholeplasmatales bacterium]|nr:hypothetical protein [Acholeplasmatales bacterium]
MLGKKEKFIIRIIIATLLVLAIGFSIVVFIYVNKDEVPYWINHFGFAIILTFISGIAFLLPMLNQSKYVGDSHGDSLMIIVGILLFLSGLLSILFSYIM